MDLRLFGGVKNKRTCFAGSTTGQQLLYALDEQVRRWEATGHVRKYEMWEFLGPILDDAGACRGIVAQDLVSMEIRALPADAVVLATGHSARDTYALLRERGIALEPKPFQLGLRVEHPQELIDRAQYGRLAGRLPPAEYALNDRQIAGAAVDVTVAEPMQADNPLRYARNCIITPHLAWSSLAARRRLMATSAANVEAFLAGSPINVVN